MKAQENIDFDWQGHRGARGLMPENTIPSFLEALKYPIKTLELDIAISKDSQIVVSHEPWMSSNICGFNDGRILDATSEKNYNIYEMNYKRISFIDCGTKGNKFFPNQTKMFVSKPTLEMVIYAVREYCQQNNIPIPSFNIELKSNIIWDDIFTPKPKVFSNLVLKEVTKLGILDKTTFQSFDIRILQELHNSDSTLTLALNVGHYLGFEKYIATLGFTPSVFSPSYELVTKDMVDSAHKLGMKVITWTVNDIPTMNKLIEMGVDGLMTDYPNLIVVYNKNKKWEE